MKKTGFAFVQQTFYFPFPDLAVVEERVRPPRYLLSVANTLIYYTSVALVEVSKATAEESFWSTAFYLVAEWTKLS